MADDLVACPNCQRLIAKNSRRCPYCSSDDLRNILKVLSGLLTIFLGLVALAIAGLGTSPLSAFAMLLSAIAACPLTYSILKRKTGIAVSGWVSGVGVLVFFFTSMVLYGATETPQQRPAEAGAPQDKSVSNQAPTLPLENAASTDCRVTGIGGLPPGVEPYSVGEAFEKRVDCEQGNFSACYELCRRHLNGDRPGYSCPPVQCSIIDTSSALPTKIIKNAIACDHLKDEVFTMTASDDAVRAWIAKNHKACVFLDKPSDIKLITKTADGYYHVAIATENGHRRWVTDLDIDKSSKAPYVSDAQEQADAERAAEMTAAARDAAAKDAVEHGRETIKSNVIGCKDKEVQDKLARFREEGDKEAFQTFVGEQEATGACTLLSFGSKVYLEDTAIFSGVVCVRPEGETSCYWIEMDSVGP